MKRFSSIQKELAISGVPKRVLNSGEARALTNILSEDETILACVQGLYEEGIGVMVATNHRFLIVNKSFLWTRMEDESYAMVNSVIYKKGIYFGKVVLSTRSREYTFHVLKKDPIETFISVIDAKMRPHARQQM